MTVEDFFLGGNNSTETIVTADNWSIPTDYFETWIPNDGHWYLV